MFIWTDGGHFYFSFLNKFLNVLIIVLQLDYKRGMNGDIRAMVEGKLVKKTEGGIGEILVKIVVKIKKSESCEEN